jgi:hypothetical protein
VFCGKPTQTLSSQQNHQALVRKAFLPTDKKKNSPIPNSQVNKGNLKRCPNNSTEIHEFKKGKYLPPPKLFIQNF